MFQARITRPWWSRGRGARAGGNNDVLVLGWCLLGERCAHGTDSGALSLAVLGWMAAGSANLTCTCTSIVSRGIPGTLRLERPNSATRSRSTQRVTPECRYFVGRGPTRGRGAAPKSIITHVPTGPRDQIILFIRAPLEDRNLPPHQEKPRAHPRPPSEGRSPGERRSAGER